MKAPKPTARSVALDVVDATLRRSRPLDDAFAQHPDLATLEGRDRAFARALSTTTVRRRGQIDALIACCLEEPLPKKASRVHDMLRIGIAQLLFMDVAAHAAVDATVKLATDNRTQAYRKLVNAVLRRIGREGAALAAAQDAPRLNTPDWLWDAWTEAYGGETCRAIATAHLGEPPLDLTVKEGDRAAWADRLGATELITGSLRLTGGGRIEELDGFADGAWWVQDTASTLPVRLFGDVRDKTVFDLCAAPGGKTAQLAALGAHVTAVDRSDKRMERLRANLDRLGLTATPVVHDVATWTPGAQADAVLLDAPCSATGTLRRHPEGLWQKKAAEIEKLTGVQDRLLDAAARMVKPGGVLVYCTCSLQPEEGPARADAFLARTADFARDPVAPDEAGDGDWISPVGDLRTLPCHMGSQGGMDGFYAARLRRRG